MNRSQAARHTTRATRPQNEPSPRRPAGKKHHVRPPRPTVRPRPTQRVRRGWAGRAGRRRGTEGQGGESERRGPNPPTPPYVHPPHCRAPGHSRAPTGPAMEPNGPARERVCPRACATARPGKERTPHTGQAGHTRSTARQQAPRHKTRHHHGKHPHPTTNEPPRTSPSPAVPAARQPPSGWTCVRPAVNPAPAGYEPAAVRMDVFAPGSEPSPCRLRNSRRPDGRVCARR